MPNSNTSTEQVLNCDRFYTSANAQIFSYKKINVATLATSDQSFWKLPTILIAMVVVVETGCNGFNLPSPTYFIWSFFACKISSKGHQLERVQE